MTPLYQKSLSVPRGKDTEPRKGPPAASASWGASQAGASDLLSEPGQGRRAGRCRNMASPPDSGFPAPPQGTGGKLS